MPIALIIIGLVLLTAGVRGTNRELGELLKAQFSGPGSFASWAFAFVLVGSLGIVEALRPLSRIFMGLMLLVLFLSNSKSGDIITAIHDQIIGPGTAPQSGASTP